MIQNKNPTFGFLVHPRNLDDLYRKYPALRFVPERVLEKIIRHFPPVSVSRITGLTSIDGDPVEGALIAITMTPKQMLTDREHAKKKVLQALTYAKKKGITYVGLGALTSVVTSGGADAVGYVPGVHVTNGNALTAGMSYLGIVEALKIRNVTDPIVTVVGATGSIGQAVARMIARDLKPSTLYLVGRTPANLERLRDELRALESGVEVEVRDIKEAIPLSDLVVTATSASEAVLQPSMLKQGAIVYDITQPQNVPKTVREQRPDVLVVDGALVQLPPEVRYRFNLGIPRDLSFACLAETMLLANERYGQDFCTGKVELSQVEYALGLAERYSFTLAPLHSWGRPIGEK